MSMETAPRKNKARGTAKNRRPLYLEIDPESIDKIERVANALGRSKAATLDLMLATITIDDAGRPEFYLGPLASELQEELPLQSAS